MKENKHCYTRNLIISYLDTFFADDMLLFKWLNKTHPSFRDNMGNELSPNEMIESGRGNEVIKLIELHLDR